MTGLSRDKALDAFRGLAVVGMAVVNLQSPSGPTLPALTHAAWNGLTLADLVFPFFVLGVGLSVPLSLDRAAESPSVLRVLRRGGLLVLLGLVLNVLLHPTVRVTDVRASGVLQRIGLVYAACALLAKTVRGWGAPALIAAFLMVLHAGVLLGASAPEAAAPSLMPGLGVSGWLDRMLLPGRLIRHGYDPEGVLSTLSAIAEGFVGVAAMRWRQGQGAGPDGRSSSLLGLGAVLAVVGFGLSAVLPLNKQLWTPPFALLTAGLGLVVLEAATAAWRRWPWAPALEVLAFAGQTALTFYVLHMIVIAILLRPFGGVKLWTRVAEMVEPLGLAPEWTSLTLAVGLGLLCLGLTRWGVALGWAVRL